MDEEWRFFAACKNNAVDFFSEDSAEILRAKQLCMDCPVDLDCLDYAILTRSGFGIWAGMSDLERRKVRRNVVGRMSEDYWEALERSLSRQRAKTARQLAALDKSLEGEGSTGSLDLDKEPLNDAVALL